MNSALAPRPPDALGRPLARPGFLDGTRALFGGLGFLARTPAAWPLAVVPVAVAAVVTILLGSVAAALVLPRITAALAPRSSFLAVGAELLAALILLAVSALAGIGLAQPLSGPALNRIVRRVEAEAGAPAWPETGAAEDMLRALQSMLVGYTLGLPVLGILALISLLFPPAAVVTFPLKVVVLALLFAWDLCDYPLSIHGLPVAARISLVWRHARAMIGFGAGLALVSLIPCVGLLFLPIGVAGAARLMRQIEQWEAQAGHAGPGPA